jgi:Trypsin-like peptidase domain/Effector-associated domain 1
MTKWIELTGPQYEQLETAMVRLFNTNSLQRLLLYRLDVTLGNVVAVGAWQQVVFDLINVAQQEGWLDDLLVAASEARPNHPALEALRAEIGLGKSVSGAEAGALEAFVQGVGGLLDPEVFRTKLAMAEAAVCQISYARPNGLPYGGTGFLVGPDLIMTNYHVMKYVKDHRVAPGAVTVLFDFKLDADGNKVNTGNRYQLADEWLIDSAPNSATDLQSLATLPDTAADQLDYALVRLATKVGCAPIPTNVPGRPGGGVVGTDPSRQWLKISDPPPAVAPDAPLFILQHPNIGMLKLAWNPKSVLAVNRSGTRIRHATATLGGSSGSPCFDVSFNVVAVHHAGDPAATAEMPANYNQAIPMTAIVNLLNERHLGGILQGQCAKD